MKKAQDALLSLDTSRIIARGYAMVQKNEEIISSVTDVAVGDQLTVRLRDGQLEVEVKRCQIKKHLKKIYKI